MSDSFRAARPQRIELPNGLLLLLLERRSLPLVSLRLAVRAGSHRDPRDRAGLSALTARLLRHGSGARNREQFAADIDFIGGHFGTTTGFDQVVVDGEFTTETLDLGLSLFRDACLHPRFDEADFERERERVSAEILAGRDDPDDLADMAFMRHALAGHPYAHAPQGSMASLARMTRADVAAHHRGTFGPSGSILVATGDIDADAFARRLAELFSGWADVGPPAPVLSAPPRLTGRRTVLVHVPGSTQAQYRTGNISVARNTPLWHDLSVANTVFGGSFTSRLVREVRVERGLTYGISSRFHAARVPGPYTIASFTRNDTLAQLDAVVSAEIEKLHDGGVTEAEVASAKGYLCGLQVRRLETAEAVASAFAEAELYGLGAESVTDYRERIQAVTEASALAAAHVAIPRGDRLTVVVGDAERIRTTVAGLGDSKPLELGVDFAESPD